MAVLVGLTPSGPVLAQQGQPLLPPSLPSTLPGGAALPSLPAGSQQDILQRILDAAGGRAMGGPPAAPAAPVAVPVPAPAPLPVPSPPRMEVGEPLSNTEAFFAARLPEQQQPLRQFGYETFRRLWVEKPMKLGVSWVISPRSPHPSPQELRKGR
jgi:hypothetical protein